MMKFCSPLRERVGRAAPFAVRKRAFILRRYAKTSLQECILIYVVFFQIAVLATIFAWANIVDLVKVATVATVFLSAGALFGWVFLETVIVDWLGKKAWPRRDQKSILKPPGYGINSALKVVFPRKIHERIFEPIVAEMQRDYIDAIIGGNPRLANWIRVRGVGFLWFAALAQLPVSLLSLVVKIWKAAI